MRHTLRRRDPPALLFEGDHASFETVMPGSLTVAGDSLRIDLVPEADP